MFSFDPSALPQITARRAFIGVDFQQAFTENGALPVTDPAGYVDRATELAAAIREMKGDVVWVRSKFDKPCELEDERILVSDNDDANPPSAAPASVPGRAGRAEKYKTPVKGPDPAEVGHPPDREAFLSHETDRFLAGDGLDWAPEVADKIAKSDLTLTKSSYSAFKGTALLRMLRAKMVMEVFICGSLTNVGVHATAIDAACHGLGITIVEDGCGYVSKDRQERAIKSIVEFTGCEIASLEDTLNLIRPQPPKARVRGKKPIDLVQTMAALKLGDEASQHVKETPPDEKDGNVDGNITTPADGGEKLEKTDDSPINTTSAPSTVVTTQQLDTEKPGSGETVEQSVQEQLGSLTLDASQEAGPMVTPDAQPSAPSNATSSQNAKDGLTTNDGHDDDGDEASPGASLCQGDTTVITDLLPKDLEDGVFDTLRNEVKWQRMSHQGGEVPRLVAVQGSVGENGSIPVYRHPADESPPLLPFSPTVLAIKEVTEKRLGHPLNHVLIQYYRDGNDYISEHSDKTLDIVRGSYIANVSLGAERTMVLRTKRPDRDLSRRPAEASETSSSSPATVAAEPADKRQVCRANLPHNSLLRMGLDTNMKWLHSIRQDRRAQRDKSPAELAFNGGRISLTFRHIATFLSADETLIWGQGASSKTREGAGAVKNGQCAEAVDMLKAFGTENRSSIFDWELHYGKGFDVLHMSTSARFFASEDALANLQVSLMLAEFGINYAKGSMGPMKQGQSPDYDALPIKFVDSTEGRPTVQGDVPIFLYLDAVYGAATEQSQQDKKGHAALAKRYTRFHQAMALSRKLQQETARVSGDGSLDISVFDRELTAWNHYGAEADGEFLAGKEPSLPDFIVWPILHTLAGEGGGDLERFGPYRYLAEFYARFGARESVKKVGLEIATLSSEK